MKINKFPCGMRHFAGENSQLSYSPRKESTFFRNSANGSKLEGKNSVESANNNQFMFNKPQIKRSTEHSGKQKLINQSINQSNDPRIAKSRRNQSINQSIDRTNERSPHSKVPPQLINQSINQPSNRSNKRTIDGNYYETNKSKKKPFMTLTNHRKKSLPLLGIQRNIVR